MADRERESTNKYLEDREAFIEEALKKRAHLLEGANRKSIEKARVAVNEFLAQQKKNLALAEWDRGAMEAGLGEKLDHLSPDDPNRKDIEKQIEKYRGEHDRHISQLVESWEKSREADLDRVVKEAVGQENAPDWMKRVRERLQSRQNRGERESDKGRDR